MFLKFICKAFFAKNIVKSVGNGGINGRSSLPVLFPGQSTTFRQNRQPFSGKPGGPTGTNTAGKNDLLRGQNKAERNCRHAQGTQQIKSRSCRTVFLCGSFCFSVLICTPNTGCPVLGVHIIFAYFSVCTRNSISGAFNLFSNHAFQFLRDRCTVCNTVKYSLQGTTQGRYLTGGVPPVRFSM